MVDPLRRVGWFLAISLLAACHSTPIRGQPDLLDFITDGSTTCVQVIARLGEPYRRLQASQVCTYRLSHDEGGRFVSLGQGEASWTDLDASLVLVFDENAVLLLVLTTSGCVPIIYSARYEAPSRQNLSDAVPAFIESGRTTMADVLLALGDPDTIAADESWIAYVSSYREGGGGAALVLVSSSSAGLLGGAFKEMLYRRLLVHFDATGIVTAATLDLVNCSNTDVFVGDASGSMAPCFDVTSTDIVARTLVANLQEAGETNFVVYRRAELLPTHQRGMVAVSDTAIHFVATGIYRTPRFPDIDIALADLTGAELGGHAFHLSAEGRRRVTLKREDAEIATFVVLAENGDDASRTTEAGELVSQRIAAVRRTDRFSRSPVVTPDGTQ